MIRSCLGERGISSPTMTSWAPGGGHTRAAHLAAVEREGAHANDRFAAVGHGLRHGTDDESSGRVRIDDDGKIAGRGHGLPPRAGAYYRHDPTETTRGQLGVL